MTDSKWVLLRWFIICFDKKCSGGGVKNQNISNQHPKELAEELQKPII